MPAAASTRGTIPLTPFLEGRGNSKKCWGTPPDPCQGLHPSGLPAFKCWGTSSMPPASGVAPLWTPPPGACGGFASIVGCTIPLPPSWKEGGIVRSPGGHPQTPAKGVAPLWTPHCNSGLHHHPCPLVGAHPPAPCQWGCTPLDTRFSGGTSSMPPASGVAPLWTSRLLGPPPTACQWGAPSP